VVNPTNQIESGRLRRLVRKGDCPAALGVWGMAVRCKSGAYFFGPVSPLIQNHVFTLSNSDGGVRDCDFSDSVVSHILRDYQTPS